MPGPFCTQLSTPASPPVAGLVPIEPARLSTSQGSNSSRRRWLVRKVVAALSFAGSLYLVFALGLGCTGSDFLSQDLPTGPIDFPDPAKIAGTWIGTATLAGVDGCGCIGATFQSRIGSSYRITDQILQSGERIWGVAEEKGSSDNLNEGTCQFTGSVFGESASQESRDCSHPTITRTCSDGSRTNTLSFKSYRKGGRASPSQMSGDIYVTFTCSRPNGTEVGEMRLFYSFAQTKG